VATPGPTRQPTPSTRLVAVKVLHTLIWIFFAACIVAIPLLAWRGWYGYALALIAVVFVEVLVVLLNDWHCPLTAVAARYTQDRRDNFDIYLPEWLARHNKLIFGTLYACGVLATALLRHIRGA
jgi:hypothetical protein